MLPRPGLAYSDRIARVEPTLRLNSARNAIASASSCSSGVSRSAQLPPAFGAGAFSLVFFGWHCTLPPSPSPALGRVVRSISQVARSISRTSVTPILLLCDFTSYFREVPTSPPKTLPLKNPPLILGLTIGISTDRVKNPRLEKVREKTKGFEV